MSTPSSAGVTRDVVLVGAGHAHVGVLKNFGLKPTPGIRLTLITRQLLSPYSGMLPGHIAGLYDFDDVHIDTAPLCRFAGARLLEDEAIGLDLAGGRVLCRNRPPVPFDLLSLDIGSTPNTGAVRGAAEHALPVKPIDGFLARFEGLRRRVLASGGRVHIGIVGGGAGGVELLLALEQRLRRDLAAAGTDPGALSFSMITSSAEVLPTFPKRMRNRFAALLETRGIKVRAGVSVVGVGPYWLELADSSGVELDEIVWTTEAAAPAFLRETGLALDEAGFVRVGLTLESVSHPGVFAVGDVAAIDDRPLPKSGVYAVRQGPALANNLRRILKGRSPAPYRPQRDALYILSTGEPYAVGTRNGIVLEGAWLWRLKDWLDRRFIRKYNELPALRR